MKKTILILASAISITTYSQKKVEVKASLLDGSNISGTSVLPTVALVTEYGKLLFPVEKINTITIGIGKDKAISDKAISLLKLLNNTTSDDTRKGAYDDIIKLGPKAIIAIEEYSSDATDNSYTGEYTSNNALSELKANYSLNDVSDVNDVVSFENGYTVGGNYEFNKLDIQTNYGLLSIPKEKIKSMDIIYIDNTNGQQVFKLVANKHISGNANGGWLKTGLMLKAGQRFTITASGEVILASLSATQKYKPSGAYVDGANSVPAVAEDGYANAGTASAYPTYGNVVYKIGEGDIDIKKAGANYSGVAKTSGMLYLSIYETVYSAANTGAYQVKVTK